MKWSMEKRRGFQRSKLRGVIAPLFFCYMPFMLGNVPTYRF
jgi:hypothetical protein